MVDIGPRGQTSLHLISKKVYDAEKEMEITGNYCHYPTSIVIERALNKLINSSPFVSRLEHWTQDLNQE